MGFKRVKVMLNEACESILCVLTVSARSKFSGGVKMSNLKLRLKSTLINFI